ncbi:2-dehydro-3-deoxygalactonokinase [Maritalea mediterranea]|uniref:2-dehydro-3-deoxygalactonokinase n=1 Tax=Maritalea mediterranea TaxID=2909667 RepID=A0ABS9ECK5_9HYPH|nr:2-dehydro-3-deoxygalactonokinase [Maritalea mediterranea]MCF4099153.1 2-dehydro-3-deoxygalactonokinase [Maritalea mediterranea]
MTAAIDYIALDWGTSNVRAYAIDGAGQIMDEATSDKGMGQLEPHQFEPTLLNLTAPWLSEDRVMPIFACGMVGARGGWQEASYGQVPFDVHRALKLTRVKTHAPHIEVQIVPGLCQQAPADVMRGEETQIFGLLEKYPDFEGTIILPGTHSKWAEIKSGQVTGFKTYMTGEMFNLLSEQSVVRLSVAEEGWDDDAFLEGVKDAMSAPQDFTHMVFGLRAQSLLAGLTPIEARAKLSGLLMGMEIKSGMDSFATGQVAIVGGEKLMRIYRAAFEEFDIDPLCDVEENFTVRGLNLVAKAQKEGVAS